MTNSFNFINFSLPMAHLAPQSDTIKTNVRHIDDSYS
jgi:hypothetical protein